MSVAPLQDNNHPIIIAHRERITKAEGDPLKTFKELLEKAKKKKKFPRALLARK